MGRCIISLEQLAYSGKSSTLYAFGSAAKKEKQVPLLVGMAGMFGFVIYERFIPAEPMMPKSVFANPTLCIAWFTTFTHGMVLWYKFPYYAEAMR